MGVYWKLGLLPIMMASQMDKNMEKGGWDQIVDCGYEISGNSGFLFGPSPYHFTTTSRKLLF